MASEVANLNTLCGRDSSGKPAVRLATAWADLERIARPDCNAGGAALAYNTATLMYVK